MVFDRKYGVLIGKMVISINLIVNMRFSIGNRVFLMGEMVFLIGEKVFLIGETVF
jgi:hypothetical protein